MKVALANQQRRLAVDGALLRRAVESILREEGYHFANVSLAVVDDPAIHRLNRQYLAHDEPTDVLSFLLERGEGTLAGEVIVSADTAARTAPQFHWTAAEELLLYVIHGALHLAGYDDATPAARRTMRRRERYWLGQLASSGRAGRRALAPSTGFSGKRSRRTARASSGESAAAGPQGAGGTRRRKAGRPA